MTLPEGATAGGQPGLGGVLAAFEDAPGTLRASWRASYFSAPDFAQSGVDLTGMGSSLAIGWSPMRRLSIALQGAAMSHHGEGMVPASVQALGDVTLSALWVPIGESYRFRAGGHAGVMLFSGDEPFDYGAAVSPFLDGVATMRAGPMKLSANLGYVHDQSEKAIPEDAVLTAPLRAAYGVSEGPYARAGLVASLPIRDGRFEPFAGAKARAWFGDVEKGDSAIATAGLRAAIGPWDRLIHLEAGIDIAVLAGEETAARPFEPPMRAFAALSFALPPARPIPLITRVEVPAPLPPPTTGDVEGMVRDGRSGEPLQWVIVEVPGVTQNPILTDAMGVYRVKGIPAGNVKVKVQKQGFAIQTQPVEIKAGAVSTLDVTLEASGTKTNAVFAGDVRGRDGKPVPAKLTFQLGSETRTITADAAGKFQLAFAGGTFSVKVDAPGFVSQTRTLTLAAGEHLYQNFSMSPVQP